MNGVARQLLLTTFVVSLALIAYDRLVLRPAVQIGVIDLGEVYRAKEREFASLSKPQGSAPTQDQAMVLAQKFSEALPRAIDSLPQDGACLVLIKSAVAGNTPNTLDLTPLLKRKLGMSS